MLVVESLCTLRCGRHSYIQDARKMHDASTMEKPVDTADAESCVRQRRCVKASAMCSLLDLGEQTIEKMIAGASTCLRAYLVKTEVVSSCAMPSKAWDLKVIGALPVVIVRL